MIPDLTNIELDTLYKRVLDNGIDGLVGLEVFQVRQLLKYAERKRFKIHQLAYDLLNVNSKYNYPDEYKGREFEYWLTGIYRYDEPDWVIDIAESFLLNNKEKHEGEDIPPSLGMEEYKHNGSESSQSFETTVVDRPKKYKGLSLREIAIIHFFKNPQIDSMVIAQDLIKESDYKSARCLYIRYNDIRKKGRLNRYQKEIKNIYDYLSENEKKKADEYLNNSNNS